MIIIPAIDLKNGRCVRLEQGRMSKETVYSEVPAEVALKWYHEGAERLHIVDLNGAVEGRPVNGGAIRDIVHAVPIPIQLGGGIRDMKTIESYFRLGIEMIILGTAAHKNPEFLASACAEFPGRIILGIDSHKGLVAVEGWREETDIAPSEMVKKYKDLPVAAIIYTDIQRDGMSTGPNVEATRILAESTRIPVIASGGISELSDVADILSLEPYGVTGMITGRALYEGTLRLADALTFIRKEQKP